MYGRRQRRIPSVSKVIEKGACIFYGQYSGYDFRYYFRLCPFGLYVYEGLERLYFCPHLCYHCFYHLRDEPPNLYYRYLFVRYWKLSGPVVWAIYARRSIW